MTIFPSIEDYLLFISGQVDINLRPSWLGHSLKYEFSISAMDETVMRSLTDSIMGSRPLTEKQGALALRLIDKYSSQLRKNGVEQPDHNTFRLGIRVIPLTKSLSIVDGKFHLRFPFDLGIITQIKSVTESSHGKIFWDREKSAWIFALTEFNLSCIMAIIDGRGFDIDADCMELYSQILAAEEIPFKIELYEEMGKYHISNAPDSLIDYIDSTIGWNNPYSLIDSAGALGYTIDPAISTSIETDLGPTFMTLCKGRSVSISPYANVGSLESILEWAIVVDRLPLVIFNPNFLKNERPEILDKYFAPEEIVRISMTDDVSQPFTFTEGVKVVYTNKVIPIWGDRVPLLISYINLLHGASKRNMLQTAEKVVYYCQELPKR